MMSIVKSNRLSYCGVLLAVTLVSSCGQSDTSDEAMTAPDEVTSDAKQYIIPDNVDINLPEQDQADLNTSEWNIKPPFYAAGREPFWRLELNDGWFVFQRLGLPEIEAPATDHVLVEGADHFDSGAMAITIVRGPCEEAQANESVSGSIIIEHEDVSYVGCVYGGETSKGEDADNAPETDNSAATDWTDEIGIYAFEVDACLQALDEKSAGASRKALITAMTSKEGGTAFIIEMSSRTKYLCVAQDTGIVQSLETVSKTEDWMQAPGRFMRVESGPPPRACLDARAVMADRHLVGYLLPRNCRP